jgi:hypothetical protein
MADLSRALGRFAHTPLLGWNAATSVWDDTGLRGRLQVYDRFITERDFGQRKRILTLAGDQDLPAAYSVIRLGNSATVYMLESLNKDIEGADVYGTTFALHQAPFHVRVCREVVETLQSGAKRKTGAEEVLFDTWVNLSRYSAVDSREFPLTDFTIYTVYFPRNVVATTDMYVRRLDNDDLLDITEVFQSLEIPAARVQRRG